MGRNASRARRRVLGGLFPPVVEASPPVVGQGASATGGPDFVGFGRGVRDSRNPQHPIAVRKSHEVGRSTTTGGASDLPVPYGTGAVPASVGGVQTLFVLSRRAVQNYSRQSAMKRTKLSSVWGDFPRPWVIAMNSPIPIYRIENDEYRR